MPATRHFDVELNCNHCGEHFVYSAGEQELQTIRGVAAEPRECPPCRRLLGRA
ncbi:MAG: zinc-ribbon domain containing protein [Chloroflexi bacterium]|nr:zinc-ribbon domain containing protein [Chloroflexota bacterium]MBV9597070.1 zinc-ribbon domain containing protein [Chloroflexota bacterium]